MAKAVDWFILSRVFQPIAHWVDYRFHKNCYDLCGWFLSAGVALNWGSVGNMAAQGHWWRVALCSLPSGALIVVYWNYIATAKKASKAYERGNQVPNESMLFWMWAPYSRLFTVFIGTALTALVIYGAVIFRRPDDYLGILLQSWLLIIGCGIYFGGCLPSGRERRKKKERRWLTTLFPRLAANPT